VIIEVDGLGVHASTGGVIPDSDDPIIVLVHGAGADSTVWQLQTRYLAHRGFRAVAVDLPGHGTSEGDAIESIPEMGRWLGCFLDSLEWRPVTLVGHSMGSFVVLEVAAAKPELVSSIVLFGTATAMPVHPDLLAKAADDVEGAAALMAAWGHGRPAHIGLNPTPGMWMIGGQRALVERSSPGALATDLHACVNYEGAGEAAALVQAPATVVIGHGDKMTPPKSGRALAALLGEVSIVELAGTGHDMMFENPRAVRNAILTAATRSI